MQRSRGLCSMHLRCMYTISGEGDDAAKITFEPYSLQMRGETVTVHTIYILFEINRTF